MRRSRGSSPRIRGEFDVGGPGLVVLGIIPANTGRIHLMVSTAQSRWDHPREYGENSSTSQPSRDSQGSSPRIRGEWQLGVAPDRIYGIIPANTGRIIGSTWNHGIAWDHPRECGENLPTLIATCVSMGSSPRIRGESACPLNPSMPVRIIPANTGRIPCFSRKRCGSLDHPREYGENIK